MRETKDYCDMCKKEIKGINYFIQGGNNNIMFKDLNLDLCVKCMNKIRRWVQNEINT